MFVRHRLLRCSAIASDQIDGALTPIPPFPFLTDPSSAVAHSARYSVWAMGLDVTTPGDPPTIDSPDVSIKLHKAADVTLLLPFPSATLSLATTTTRVCDATTRVVTLGDDDFGSAPLYGWLPWIGGVVTSRSAVACPFVLDLLEYSVDPSASRRVALPLGEITSASVPPMTGGEGGMTSPSGTIWLAGDAVNVSGNVPKQRAGQRLFVRLLTRSVGFVPYADTLGATDGCTVTLLQYSVDEGVSWSYAPSASTVPHCGSDIGFNGSGRLYIARDAEEHISDTLPQLVVSALDYSAWSILPITTTHVRYLTAFANSPPQAPLTFAHTAEVSYETT